jgi:hypothetical protein
MLKSIRNKVRCLAIGLLLCAALFSVPAQSATYRDTSGMPMIQMMLIMMDLMGMLNRVPNGGYGWPAYAPLNSAAAPFGGGLYPYSAMSGLQGMNTLNQGTNLFNNAQTLNGFNNAASGWNSVLKSGQLQSQTTGVDPDLHSFPPASEFSPGDNWGMGTQTLSNPWEPLPSATGSNYGLNGIWQGEAGDMVAIYGNRFMWSGSGDRSLSGQLKLEGEYLMMGLPSSGTVLMFRVQVNASGGFTVMDSSGRVMRFRRLY